MKCKNCNLENQASARFCAGCGGELDVLNGDYHLKRSKASTIVRSFLLIGLGIVGFFVIISFIKPSIDVCDIKTRDEVMKSSIKKEMNGIKDIAAKYQGGFSGINKDDSIQSIFRGGMFKGFAISKRSIIRSADQKRVANLLEHIDLQVKTCSRSKEIQQLIDELPFSEY